MTTKPDEPQQTLRDANTRATTVSMRSAWTSIGLGLALLVAPAPADAKCRATSRTCASEAAMAAERRRCKNLAERLALANQCIQRNRKSFETKVKAAGGSKASPQLVSANGASLLYAVESAPFDIKSLKSRGANKQGTYGAKTIHRRVQHYAQPKVKVPTSYWRVDAWRTNDGTSKPVRSCEEYVYDSLRGWSRFEDAVTACRGNPECIWEQAFIYKLLATNGNPNTLKDTENKPISPSLASIAGPPVSEYRNAFVHAWDLYKLKQIIKLMIKPPREAQMLATVDKYSKRLGELSTANKRKLQYANRLRMLDALGKRFRSQGGNVIDARAARSRADEFRYRIGKVFSMWDEPFKQVQIMTSGGRGVAKLLNKKEYFRDVPAIGPVPVVTDPATAILDPRILPIDQFTELNKAATLISQGTAAQAALDRELKSGRFSKEVRAAQRQSLQRQAKGKSGLSRQFSSAMPSIKDLTEDYYVNPVMGAQLERVIELLEDELTRWNNGKSRPDEGASCLSNGYAGCDFAYEDVLGLVVGRYDDRQEELYQECVEAFGTGPFNNTLTVAVKSGGQYTLQNESSSVKRTPSKVKGYAESWHAFIEQELKKLPVYPGYDGTKNNGSSMNISSLHLQPRGQNKDGGQWYGSDRFGAGYDYSAGWKVTPLSVAGRDGVCALKGEAWAQFRAGANVLGSAGSQSTAFRAASSLLSPSLSVVTKLLNAANTDSRLELHEGKAKLRSHLILFGEKVYAVPANATGGQSVEIQLNAAVSNTGDGGSVTVPNPKLTATVTLMGLPLTMQGWAELGYGYGYAVKSKMNGKKECLKDPTTTPFDGHLKLIPTAGMSGFASVGVGVPGFQVGVRGALTLLQGDLPIDSKVQLVGAGKKVDLEANVAASLVLRQLSGKIQVFAEAGFWEAHRTFFRWEGFRQDVPLFELSETMNLISFCGPAGSNPTDVCKL